MENRKRGLSFVNNKEQPIGLLNGNNIISPVTMKQQAYDLIKDAILYRRLKIGTTYSQDALCNELNISRTPVREALLELQKEGYIEIMRGKGIQVIPITQKRALDIVEARYYLEINGARLAAKRRTDENIANMERLQHQLENKSHFGQPRDPYQLDRQLHHEIFLAAGNTWMEEEIEKLRDHFLRIETQSAFESSDRTEQVNREHRQILAAIREQDEQKAAEAMRYHMDCTVKRTINPALVEKE